MSEIKSLPSAEREEMTEAGKMLFLNDVSQVIDEYFEREGQTGLEITRSEDGFIACVLFTARRVKNVKRPQ